LEELLSAFTYLEVAVEEVLDHVEELMGSFGLSSYDAVHAATAEYASAPTLVTTDMDFATIPEERLTIYTSASRIGRYRRTRRGH
jgi:predicted nucleic acid-binding protein